MFQFLIKKPIQNFHWKSAILTLSAALQKDGITAAQLKDEF